MPRALIIDDEPSGRAALRVLLADHASVTITGEAGTLAKARELLARDDYDLVFLDIQLRGGTGFDLVPAVRGGARIIFVTAFDQHALRAIEINALDYLVKPVAPERLAASLLRLSSAASPQPLAASKPGEGGSALNAQQATPFTLDDRILVRLGPITERFVRLGDIRTIASCENYSEVMLDDGPRLFVRRTLKNWEDALPPAHFARAHRHLIINVRHIDRLERATVSTFHVHLAGLPEPVRASYRYIAGIRAKSSLMK